MGLLYYSVHLYSWSGGVIVYTCTRETAVLRCRRGSISGLPSHSSRRRHSSLRRRAWASVDRVSGGVQSVADSSQLIASAARLPQHTAHIGYVRRRQTRRHSTGEVLATSPDERRRYSTYRNYINSSGNSVFRVIPFTRSRSVRQCRP